MYFMKSIFSKTCQFASTILFFILYSNIVLAQDKEAILGTWYNSEKSAKIQIIKNGPSFLGKIVWLESNGSDSKIKQDTKNPDPKLRNRPLMGLTILEDLKYENGTWKDGQIYDPESGKTYSSEIKLKNKDTLEVKGYLGFSWIGKTVVWTRVN